MGKRRNPKPNINKMRVNAMWTLLVFFLQIPAWASPAYLPSNIPNCQKNMLATGDIVCSYTLKELKRLYEADADLTRLKKEKTLLERKADALDKIIGKQKLQFELAKNSSELLAKRARELTSQLLKTDRALQMERSKPKWGSYLAWGTALVIASIFTGYIIADQIAKKEGCPLTP